MVAAAIAFTQGANVGAAGQAAGYPPSYTGVTASAVTVSNGVNTGVTTWTFSLLAVPPGSALTIGVKQSGATPTWPFTPDVVGSYRVQLTVVDNSANTATDVRVFAVPELSGRLIPPFGGNAADMNFGGSNAQGWAPYQDAYDKYVDVLAATILPPVFFAGLASLTAAQDGQVVELKGYTTVGDGGEGFFQWKSTDNRATPLFSTAAAGSDGGTYAPGSGGAGVAGRWVRVYSGPVNVRHFGVTGLGPTVNDAPAIRNAVASAYAQRSFVSWTGNGASGFTVGQAPQIYFPTPPVSYAVDSTIEIAGPMTVQGDKDVVIQPTIVAGNTFALFRINADVAIRQIAFVNGKYSIALFGYSQTFGGAFTPQGNGKIILDTVQFSTPRHVALWHDPSPTDNGSTYRSFQHGFFLSNYRCDAPTIYWGCGDYVNFDQGMNGWDQGNITPAFSGDGLSLGYINTNGHFSMTNAVVDGIGSGTPWPPRPVLAVGGTTIKFRNVIQFDLAGVCVRQRLTANTYQGNNITTPTTLVGTATATNGSVTVTFTNAQTLTGGTVLLFSNQPGVLYPLAASIAGATTATLTTPFTGATSSGLTALNAQNLAVSLPHDIGANVDALRFSWEDGTPNSVFQNLVEAYEVFPREITVRNASEDEIAASFGVWCDSSCVITPVLLAGTVSVTNGSPNITFSVAQTLPQGAQVVFASQPNFPYYIASATSSSTSATLIGSYSGATNGATTTVQMGALNQHAINQAIKIHALRQPGFPCKIRQSAETVALSGTVTVTNGSPNITFSVAQTFPASTVFLFASQPGIFYKLVPGITASTTGTLLTAYTGTTATGGATVQLSQMNVGPGITEVTGQLQAYIRHLDWDENDVEMQGPVNLFNTGIFRPNQLVIAGGDLGDGSPDTSTGYPLDGWTASALCDPFSFQTPNWTGGFPAGVYCFSMYAKANFSGEWGMGLVIDGINVNLASHRFHATEGGGIYANQYQRVWMSFYWPGGSHTLAFNGACYPGENGDHLNYGLFQVNPGARPCAYVFPTGQPNLPIATVIGERYVRVNHSGTGGAQASPFSARAGDKVVCDCSGGNVVVNLPVLNPGQACEVKQDESTAYGGFTITVNAGTAQNLSVPPGNGTFATSVVFNGSVTTPQGASFRWKNYGSAGGDLVL